MNIKIAPNFMSKCKLPDGKPFDGNPCMVEVKALEAEVKELGKDDPLPSRIVRSVRGFSCGAYGANVDPLVPKIKELCAQLKASNFDVDLTQDAKKIVSLWNIVSDCVSNKDTGIRSVGIDAEWVIANLAHQKLFLTDRVTMEIMWKQVIPSGSCAQPAPKGPVHCK
jgi:hypothetical protein